MNIAFNNKKEIIHIISVKKSILQSKNLRETLPRSDITEYIGLE